MLASLTALDLLALLNDWADRGWLRALDAAFARFLAQEVPDAPVPALLAAALASHQLGRGHACLDLAATLQDPALALSLPPEGARLPLAEEAVPLPDAVLEGLTLERWQAALTHPTLVAAGVGATPLVHRDGRLYLRRYWQYEQDVREGLARRLAVPAPTRALPEAALRHTLDVLFAGRPTGDTDWQRVACALAARSGFAIITGGPGTGKTTTVVRLLALLQGLALSTPHPDAEPRPLRIRLAAPTGKAAARLNESIANAVASLPLAGLAGGEAVREHIPRQVTTLHRLLGTRPGSRQFRHDRHHPLALDVLVIDEASMVDLEMMAAVLDALPERARLVLLGDKDQLASVEAGAVLGELCRRAADGHYTPATAQWLTAVSGQAIPPALVDDAGTPLDQAVVMLRHSHRFSAASGIGQLAGAVNAGNPRSVEAVWRQDHEDIARVSLTDATDPAFTALVVAGGTPAQGQAQADLFAEPATLARHGYAHYLQVLRGGHPALHAGRDAFDAWARRVLAAHTAFQVLCALRRGPWGVEGLNLRIARLLREAGLIDDAHEWYLGRPVLVTRNDYGLGLMNGDIGITLALPSTDARGWTLRVAFPAGDGDAGIRWVLPSRLQAVETVFALTVHKSQGSEFGHAALVLPDTLNPILTRELLYTGITRARHCLTVTEPAGRHLLGQAVQRRVLRASGLADTRL